MSQREMSQKSRPGPEHTPEESSEGASYQEATPQKASSEDTSSEEAFSEEIPWKGSGAESLKIPGRLQELQESLGRLEDFASQAQAENTTLAYAADLKDFRHWCKKLGREWLPAEPKTVGLYLGALAGTFRDNSAEDIGH